MHNFGFNEQLSSNEEQSVEHDSNEEKHESLASPETEANAVAIDACDDSIPAFVGSPDEKPSDHKDFVR